MIISFPSFFLFVLGHAWPVEKSFELDSGSHLRPESKSHI
jgi:hypothetical protein